MESSLIFLLNHFPLPQGDTAGDYRKAMLLLCGSDDA